MTFTSAAQTSDIGYIAFNDTELVKTDSAGNIQWSESYNSTDPDSAHANSGIVTNDGDFAVAGSIDHPDSTTLYFWAAKFAPESINPTPTTEASPPFSTTVAIVIAVIIVVAVITVLLFYFKKRKH